MWQHGFLGYDASFMLDFVVTSLVALVPVQFVSLWVVKVRKDYVLHRNLQLALGLILLAAVTAFEVDTHVIHGGWENIVNKNADSPRLTSPQLDAVRQVLYIHLVFAVTTPFLWAATIALALKKFPRPPQPGPHSELHKKLGWLSVIDLTLTSVTGIWFYMHTFVMEPAPAVAADVPTAELSADSTGRNGDDADANLPISAPETTPFGLASAQSASPLLSSTLAQPRPFEIYDRRGIPDWEVDADFPDDVFTFVRIQYNAWGGGRGKWRTDYPDSDLNVSFRLQQLTSLRVNPDPIILDLTDPRLFDYPFIYIIEPGGDWGYPGTGMNLTPAEVAALRRYLDQGGFLMVDDFWGEQEYFEFLREIRKVFPDRDPIELPIEHPIFHCVYDLQVKPQVPSINQALQGRSRGVTWERPDAREVHYQGIFDDNGRMMVIVCHNTDLGDGWEREGENEWYFHEFSEKWAYPMGINIIFYAMTH
jgi:hypothetical protein